jgi:dihydrodipicolinate reductase
MKESPVRVLLIGAAGRMGKTVFDLAQSDREIEITERCDLGDSIQPAM